MKLFFHILVNCTNIFEKIAKSREIMFSGAYVSHTKIRLFRFFFGPDRFSLLKYCWKQTNKWTNKYIYFYIITTFECFRLSHYYYEYLLALIFTKIKTVVYGSYSAKQDDIRDSGSQKHI